MMYREIFTVYSVIHTQQVNAVCVQNVLGLNVKRGGTYSNQRALKLEHEFSLLSRNEFSQTKPMSMQYTDMRHLTTGIRSKQCVVRRFRRCVNFKECSYTNLSK